MAPPTSRARRLLRRLFLGATLVLLGLAGVGALYQTIATRLDAERLPPPGQLVDVGGHRLHLQCQGEGSPTVVLEAGAHGSSPFWGSLQPELARRHRVCAYDRAGLGWSEPAQTPRDALHLTEELHTLLERAQVPGPYVLVGHSLGGLLARVYVDRYPEQVVAVALLDSTHPDQLERFPEDDRQGFRVATLLFRHGLPMLARLGVLRATGLMGQMIEGLPPRQHTEAQALLASTRYMDSAAQEWAHLTDIMAQARASRGLEDLPLLVVSAGEPMGDIRALWGELQKELAALSQRSTHITLHGSNHGSLVLEPEYARQVAAAIHQLAAPGQPATNTADAAP